MDLAFHNLLHLKRATGAPMAALKQKSQSLPMSLDELYEGALNAINEDNRIWVLVHALQWIAHAPTRPSDSTCATFITPQEGKEQNIMPKTAVLVLRQPMLVEDCIKLAIVKDDFMGQLRESLNLAARNGCNNVIELLLKHEACSSQALGIASSVGAEEVVRTLLASDPGSIDRTDTTGYAPLHYATSGGRRGVVILLLQGKANSNTPTSDRSHASSISAVLGKETQPENNSDEESSFSCSSLDSYSNSRNKAAASRRSATLETSLHLAARWGHVEIARILLESNANAKAENSFGYDAFKFAAMGGSVELMSLLQQYEVDIDRPTTISGDTALHLAVMHGRLHAVSALIHGSEKTVELIERPNKDGLSPIHIASRDRWFAVLELMLKHVSPERLARRDQSPKTPNDLEPFIPHPHRQRSALDMDSRERLQEDGSYALLSVERVSLRAFQNVCGKLYPSVSFRTPEDASWTVSAGFPDRDGTSASFMFKRDLDGEETLVPPDIPQSEDSSSSDHIHVVGRPGSQYGNPPHTP
ncbi:ankyrin repeat-containing domain protein [Bombardia bombarda]|uniref:Ankyrin repeat-containing domain protein n=1 Tax=Bombardia bombarda TaxID=252184 RepID=A0AA39WH51_9PEZI|nr:ankyrin repeat-containing domain protein [Bombardia bombarda]